MPTFAKDQLKAIIERVERLEEEKKAIADDIRDVYAEAKANGFDVKALRAIVKLRKMEAAEREEQQAVLETYMHALGMLADLPLGQAAVERETRKAAASPAVRNAVKKMGTPVPLTDEEKEKGCFAAFDQDGTRMTLGTGRIADPPPPVTDQPVTKEIDLTIPESLRRAPAH